MASDKLQIALYWAAACGGCDVAVLDTDEFILDVAAAADIRLWPIAVDGKYADIEAMEDGELDLTIFNGAVRNSENEHLAKLLRAKSKLLVAFGSCAHLGGIPGLANLTSRDEILSTAYLHNPSHRAGQQDAAAAGERRQRQHADDPRLLQARLQAGRHRAGRLLRPRLSAGRRPGQGRAAGRGGRRAAGGRLRGRRVGQGPVRGLRPRQERETDQALLPALADHDRPRGLPARARDPVRRPRDAVRLRGAVSIERYPLSRLLRTASTASSIRVRSCSRPSSR